MDEWWRAVLGGETQGNSGGDSESGLDKDGAGGRGEGEKRAGENRESLAASSVPLETTVVDNSGGTYPTEAWQVHYYSADRQGGLHEHEVQVRVPAGLAAGCTPVSVGRPGCIYGVRRWGFVIRPSALMAAGFDPTPLVPSTDDGAVLRAILQAAAFELPGEFVLGSPEHPLRLTAADGRLRGSFVEWRTYLGALAYFVSEGKVDASFLRFWAESDESYRMAVEFCLEALKDRNK